MQRSWMALALCAGLAACGDGTDAEDAVSMDSAEVDSVAVGEAAAPAATGALLDPDQASREELQAIPGMDAELADSLIARRPFADMTAVDAVLAGRLSEEQRDTVYTRLWKPLDPNSATDEEILLIPGVGDRMLHEFKEYRPWQNAVHFRREIGKYVDEQEVARLEKYIRLP